MGLRKLRISSLGLQQLMSGENHYKVIEDELPEDIKIINASLVWPHTLKDTGTIEILLESASFEGPTDGEEIPYITPCCCGLYCNQKIGDLKKILKDNKIEV